MPQYQMPRLAQIFGGASAAPPQSLVLLVNQPDQARYAGLQASRFLVEAQKRLEGATVHESYLFAVGQPQIRLKYQIPRVRRPVDVATVAVTQTDVFTTLQPDQARFALRQMLRYQAAAPARVHESAAAVPPQTYLFPLVQHYEARWYLRRPIVAAPSRVHEGAAAVVTLRAPSRNRILYIGQRNNVLIVPPRQNVLHVPARPKLIHDF